DRHHLRRGIYPPGQRHFPRAQIVAVIACPRLIIRVPAAVLGTARQRKQRDRDEGDQGLGAHRAFSSGGGCVDYTYHQRSGLAPKPAARSSTEAWFSSPPSSQGRPLSCKPSGSPCEFSPAGSASAGSPARFTVT